MVSGLTLPSSSSNFTYRLAEKSMEEALNIAHAEDENNVEEKSQEVGQAGGANNSYRNHSSGSLASSAILSGVLVESLRSRNLGAPRGRALLTEPHYRRWS